MDDAAPHVPLAERLAGPVLAVAPTVLGTRLAVSHDAHEVVVRIEEVEAYDQDDPASHAYGGPTGRNRVMFGPPGHLYVYRSHGIHLCANVVCGPEGHGAAVLLRGGTVVAGRETAVARRGGRDGDAWLAAGPGRLAQALGLRADDDSAWLLGEGRVRLLDRPEPVAASEAGWSTGPVQVVSGPRVGVTRAPDRPWRFWLRGAPGVSTYRRSPRAPAPDSP